MYRAKRQVDVSVDDHVLDHVSFEVFNCPLSFPAQVAGVFVEIYGKHVLCEKSHSRRISLETLSNVGLANQTALCGRGSSASSS